DTSITVTAPATSGTVAVVATNAAGASNPLFFTYGPPVVAAVSPNAGPTTGGTVVTITGTGLLNATSVAFGATAASSFTINSDTSITATTAPAAAGTVDVTVTNAAGTSATGAGDLYTYGPPVETSLAPTAGSVGTTVTITGTGLANTTSVTFGGVLATVVSVSDTSITVTAPATSGTVAVVATN